MNAIRYVIAWASCAVLFSAVPLRADMAACVAVSGGAETNTGSSTVQNIGQSVIGTASNGSIHMHAGILACLNAKLSPTILSAVSRKPHGGAGTFNVNVLAASAIEPRSPGPTQLVINFNQTVHAIGGGLDLTDVSLSNGTPDSLGLAGSQLTINLSAATDAQPVMVTFPGIAGVSNTVVIPGVCFGALLADATADKVVNIFDLIAIRNVLNQTVVAGNFTRDVNADGSINIFDLIAARNNLNHVLSPTCP